ncbi:MAG TPA: PD-(D/E)XK nuclease family protein, partial [Acidimicrobiales bacterium]|nr:PD-(D/E)XK nuclease family protein [Acidimicrobiales bacterium]
CPWSYLGERLLEVVPAEDPSQQLEMSAMTRGSLVHEVLERFVSEVLARPPGRRPAPAEPWSAGDHARIRAIAAEVCAEYEAQGVTGRPVFWRRDRAQVVALADRFLFEDDRHRSASGTRPAAAEHAFGVHPDGPPPVRIPLPDGRSLSLRGAIDRIDEGPAGLVVLDYKTGTPAPYSGLSADAPDGGGTHLQLVVYAFAARARAGDPAAPVRSEYWFVSDRGGFAHRGYAVDDGVVARVTTTLGTIVRGIEEGRFPHHPVDGGGPFVTCPWCDPDGLGVAEARRGWERMRHDPALAPYAQLTEPLGEGAAG